MRVLIFDTETTGLPKNRTPAYDAPGNWPHLVSISWAILDSHTNKIEKERSYIIYPDSWVIPEESTAIHGITHAQAVEKGVTLKNAMIEFISENYDIMVAHNMNFDENVLVNAIRWDMATLFEGFTKPRYCSMNLTRSMCNLKYHNNWGGTKPPKLKELYEIVMKKKPDETKLHSSAYDVALLVEIVQNCEELRKKLGFTQDAVETTNGLLKKVLYI
jgi:DNA polymerase III epsilon subunit-like protein